MKWFYEIVIALLFLNPVKFVYPVSEVKRGQGNLETEELLPVLWKIFTVPTYSTVSFVRCKGVFSPTDLTFNFTVTYRSPALTGNHYSEYQLLLYQTVSEHQEQGMTFDAIAE